MKNKLGASFGAKLGGGALGSQLSGLGLKK